MSERAPYSRVYWSVMDDPKFDGIYEDDAAFALWMRLLMNADALWPAPAPLHRTAKPKALAKLVEAGIVDLLPRDRYRIHGLDAERGRRRDAARTGGKSDPNGTQTGGKREPNGSPARALAEPSQAETRKAEPSNGRADAMDTYWTLLGMYPNGRTKEWLQELVNEFDDVRVSAALAVEVNGPRQGVLSRVRDRLRSDADKAARANAAAETERLEAEAAARQITPEQAAENRRRVAEELRKMGVKG
jgi:hypothetical protein